MSTVDKPEVIIIRSWPKMIFLWPITLMALACALCATFAPGWDNIAGAAFLVCVALNMAVLTFDFPRSTSLTVFIFAIALVLALVLINQKYGIVEPLQTWLKSLEIRATRDFYFTIFIVLFVLYLGMMIVSRFDYWELTSNELIHHSGLLGDVERFSTAGLKLNTEINDIFEFVLAGSGRIVMNIAGNSRPIVLENVLFISSLRNASNRMLSHRVVEVAKSDDDKERGQGEYE